MASLKFEGDLNGLSERQVQFIREVIEKQGYENNTVLFEPVGKVGDNYVANVKRIIVVVNGADDFKMIVKIASQHEVTRQVTNAVLVFKNEIMMYNKVLPKLISLQKSGGIPENEILKYAKCYGNLSEEPNELILLEDLKQSDYAMLDRFVPLEDDAVTLILKQFAILHSLSFVLKQLEPETFMDFKIGLIDIMLLMDGIENFKEMFKSIEETAVEIMDDENYKKAIRGLVSDYPNMMKRVLKFENDRHLIIQQGDAWTNNVMFKRDEGRLVDAIMIDYQLSKAANPVCDLLYMIFNCTDHATRSKNYHKWIDYYHAELDKSLSNFGLKASLLYPRDQLDTDLKTYSKMYFCISVLLSSMLTRNEEEAAMAKDAMKTDDIETMQANLTAANLSANTVKIFKTRVMDLINSYREFGYLPLS